MFALATGSPASKENIIKSAKKSHQREVRLAGYYLKDIPGTLFDYPIPQNLVLLDLSNNCLNGVTVQIGELANLRSLFLNGNKLETLPSSFGCLVKLQTVDLSRNLLRTVPQCINSLKKLEWINLSGNCLTEIPVYLLCLPRLNKVFCLRNTRLKNVPRSVAREGLQSMRDYLHVKVEEDLSDLSCSDSAKYGIDPLDILSEIKSLCKSKEDSHDTLGCEAKTSFDYSTCKYCGRSGYERGATPTGHVSTQTDDTLICEHENIWDTPITSDLKDYVSSKRELDSSDEDASDDEGGSQNDVIEKISKLYREQLNLVSEERTRVLLAQIGRKSGKGTCYHSEHICMAPKCTLCGLSKAVLSSSEYGTMTEASHQGGIDVGDSEYFSDNDSCCGITGNTSDIEFWSDDESCIIGNDTGFSSPRSQMEDHELPSWTYDLTIGKYLTANRELVMIQDGAKITIPEFNLSGHTHDEFSIQYLEGISLQPDVTSRSVIASPIIQALPHGAKFFSANPATISIPLFVVLEDSDQVKCLVSDTGPDEAVSWKEVDSAMVSVIGDSVLVKTTHFSMFCAVAVKPYPKVEKDIDADKGGVIENDAVIDGVSVYFPPNSLTSNIKASVEVLHYDQFYLPQENDRGGRAIASPIVALAPSGMTFQQEVEVTIPLPNGRKVIDRFGTANLSIVYSQSQTGERPNWQILDTMYQIKKADNGDYYVSFYVQHFTLFGILWNILDSALPDDMKLYASSYVSHFSFWVFFQALMTECHHNKQFGICVMCCRSGHPVQGLPQYPIEIGECKPRKIKTGELEIRLKSGLFRADVDAGEAETGLIKYEHFTGREFDKQFACVFNDSVPDYGLLGQVEIRQRDEDGSSRELFSYNLVKSSKRKVVKSGKEPSEWESKLFRDLAEMLSVDDHLWQEFALALGYNRYEIREKFGAAEDRMQEILIDYKTCRNGDPEDFSQALIRVARTFKLVPVDQMMENRQNRRAEHAQGESSSRRERPARYCRCPPTPPKSPQGLKRKLDLSDETLTDSRFDDIASEIAKSWKSVGRKLALSDQELREIENNYQHSGEKEKAFQMLTVWRERDPDNCTLQMLHDTLNDAGLRFTAKRCLETSS